MRTEMPRGVSEGERGRLRNDDNDDEAAYNNCEVVARGDR